LKPPQTWKGTARLPSQNFYETLAPRKIFAEPSPYAGVLEYGPLGHAALLPHDRHPAFLPGLYRHPRRDLVGRLDLRRADLSALPCRVHIETPAAIEHRARHRDHRLVRAALQRNERSSAQFLRRRHPDPLAAIEAANGSRPVK
jgi:hypothetical protein